MARAFPITILILGLASLIAVFLISANPPEPAPAPELIVASLQYSARLQP